MDLNDFKREYPAIAAALIAEGRALENGGAVPDPATTRWQLIPDRAQANAGAAPKPSGQVAPKLATGAVFTPDHATATDDQRVRREWDCDPALRAEFVNDFAAFAAFRRAEARGAVRAMRSESN